MRGLTLVFAALLVLVQYPMWLGKGGWVRVWDIETQVRAQGDANLKLQQRNEVMDAEVRDLKHGLDAVEERARSELGMVKQGELFFQIDDHRANTAPAAPKQ